MNLNRTRARLALLPEDQRDDILAAIAEDLLADVTVTEADDSTIKLMFAPLGALDQVRITVIPKGDNSRMYDLERDSVKVVADFLNLWLELRR